MKDRLVVLETHPVQYHAPVYRHVQSMGLDTVAVYGSDFSVAGYRDEEFGTHVAWDQDLTSGYSATFLQRSSSGDPVRIGDVSGSGLLPVLRELDPAAILLTGYGLPFHRQAALTSLRTGRPMLLRAETTDHAEHRRLAKHLVRDGLLRGLYARMSSLLYIGARSFDHFRRLGVPDEKLVFSPYCVAEGTFDADEAARLRWRVRTRASLDIDDGRRVLLFSGKLVAHKGVHVLLDAVDRLPSETRRHLSLVFMGEGVERGAIEAWAGRRTDVQTSVLGFRNQSALSPIFHAADALVLPSQSGETWGLVVNEALHHGLPVVVSDAVGCAPDLVSEGRTGEVFDTGRAEALAGAIERLFGWWTDDSDIREGCRRQVSSYTVHRAAAGIVEAVERTLRAA